MKDTKKSKGRFEKPFFQQIKSQWEQKEPVLNIIHTAKDTLEKNTKTFMKQSKKKALQDHIIPFIENKKVQRVIDQIQNVVESNKVVGKIQNTIETQLQNVKGKYKSEIKVMEAKFSKAKNKAKKVYQTIKNQQK